MMSDSQQTYGPLSCIINSMSVSMEKCLLENLVLSNCAFCALLGTLLNIKLC